MTEMIDLGVNELTASGRKWPEKLAAPPPDLLALIEDAMQDFGPDSHVDGADVIGALVMKWFYENFRDYT